MSNQPPPGSSSSSSRRSKPPMIVGGYELKKKLGAGAMGAVFLARQMSLDRLVALKLLPPAIAKDKQFIERFQREARACGKLNHPNIVRGIDVGHDPKNNLWYFAMEYIDGPTLNAVLKKEGRLPEERVREIALQMGSALAYANERKIVHRDIKPDNILINSDGLYKLADLGLAKKTGGDEDAGLTQAGKAVGTPFYMSPEQVRGQGEKIDIRADLYALGATLYHLAVGEPPFSGKTGPEIMSKHLTEKVPLAHLKQREVSEGFSRLLADMMTKDLDRRLSSPQMLLASLDGLKKGKSLGNTTSARTTIRPRPVRPDSTTGPRTGIKQNPVRTKRGETTGPHTPRENNQTQLLLIGGGVLLAMIVGAVMFSGGPTPQTNPRPKTQASANKPAANKAPSPALPAAQHEPKSNSVAPAVASTPVANPDELLTRAKALAADNPLALFEFTRLFDEADAATRTLDTASQDPMKAKIKTERAAAQTRFDAAVDKAWTETLGRIDAARKDKHFDAALGALQLLPKAAAEVLAEKIKAQDESLRREADGQTGALAGKIEQAMKATDWPAATTALTELAALDYGPARARAGELRRQLKESRAQDAARMKEMAAGARVRWLAKMQAFDHAVLDNSDLDKARKLAAEMDADPELKPLVKFREALRAVAGAFSGLKQREQEALAKLVGLEVDWKVKGSRVKGKVQSLRGDAVMVSADMGGSQMDLPVKLKDLTAEQRAQIVPKFEPENPSEFAAAALLRLAKPHEDWAEAEVLLKKADDFPLAKRYLRIIARLRMGEANFAAEQAWKQFAAKTGGPLDADRAKALLKEMDAVLAAHEKTDWVAQHTDDVSAVRNRLQLATGRGLPTEGLLSRWRFVGKFDEQVPAEGKKTLAAVIQGGRPAEDGSGMVLGEENQVNVPDNRAYQMDEGLWTFAVWFKTTAEDGVLLYQGNTTRAERDPDCIELRLRNGEPTFRFDMGQGRISARGPEKLNDGQWHLMVGQRSERNVAELYVDGKHVMRHSEEQGSRSVNLPGPLFIGNRKGRRAFQGTIREVIIYDRTLSADQIRDLYLATKP